MTESTILAAALAALESGLCPIRAKADGTKAPLGQWKQWQEQRPDEADVRAWFSDWPNLGLVTGAISDRLVCLEFEGRAMDLLPRVREVLGMEGLWDTFESWVLGYSELTPSGGLHILIHLGGDEPLDGNTKLASDAQGQTLIETRGEGGFVITAPSNGDTHPSGGAWRINNGGFGSIAWVEPSEWEAVCMVLGTFDAAPRLPELVTQPSPRLEGVLAADSWIDQVQRPSMADVLTNTGWTFDRRDANYSYWVRPGKDPRLGISATINANDRLFVHSSNASPVPCSHPSGQTFDVVDIIGCYDLGHLPSSDERVGIIRRFAELSGQRPPAKPRPKLSSDDCHLPDDFWQARPVLDQIMVAARSRRVSPDAVLAAVMCRVAACSPHTIRLPPLIGGSVPLSYMTLLVGPPETGKSAANRVATALIPAVDKMADGLPVGTGEGLIDILFAMVDEVDDNGKKTKVRRQVLHNAYVYVDEGAALTATGSRAGATLMPTLRTIFTGGILGNTLADMEKRRIVPAGNAVYGVVVAVQPEVAAGLLSMSEVLAGTPQRFTFASALDPSASLSPPDWPGMLAWAPPHPMDGQMGVTTRIANEIHEYHHSTQQGSPRDRLDAHLLLRQEKAAGILAILEGRLNIDDDDWELAGMQMATSNAVRGVVQTRIRESTEAEDEAADTRVVRRHVRVAAGIERSEIDETMETVIGMISRHPDGVKRQQLYRNGSDRTKRNLDAALALGIERGRVGVIESPGQGQPKRRYVTLDNSTSTPLHPT